MANYGLLTLIADINKSTKRQMRQVNALYRDSVDTIITFPAGKGEETLKVSVDDWNNLATEACKGHFVEGSDTYKEDQSAFIIYLGKNELVDTLPLMVRSKIETIQKSAEAELVYGREMASRCRHRRSPITGRYIGGGRGQR